MTLMALLIRLRAGRVRIEADGGELVVDGPEDVLTDDLLDAIRAHKEALLALPRPYLDARGVMIVPIDAPPQYHWQPIEERLREVGAPPDVWGRYTSHPYPGDEIPSAVESDR